VQIVQPTFFVNVDNVGVISRIYLLMIVCFAQLQVTDVSSGDAIGVLDLEIMGGE